MKFTQRSIPYHFGLTLGAPDMLQALKGSMTRYLLCSFFFFLS